MKDDLGIPTPKLSHDDNMVSIFGVGVPESILIDLPRVESAGKPIYLLICMELRRG